jgi:hypothetical protein
MFSLKEWVDATHQHCDDPTQFKGNNPKCDYNGCDNEIEFMDDVCIKHQLCEDCGEYNCECRCQFYIDQYNRNREYKDHVNNINEIDY